MPTRLSVTNQRQTATKRIVLCCGCVGLSFLAIVGSGLLQRTQASENILPDRQVSAAPTKIQPKLAASYGKLPLSFEANQGQTDSRVRFLARGGGYTIFLTDDGAVLALRKSQPRMSRLGKFGFPGRLKPFRPLDPLAGRWPSLAGDWESLWRSLIPDLVQLFPQPSGGKGAVAGGFESQPPQVVRMRLVGGNAKARVVGLDELPGRSNYFIGNDPKKWRTNVPSYARVKYEGVYAGVDLVYYGNQRQLEYDFVVAPGADPNQIKLSFAGADAMRVDAASGDLVAKVGGDELRLHKPVAYQPAVAAVSDRRLQSSVNLPHAAAVSDPSRRSESAATAELDGTFVLASNNEAAFRVAGYDPKRALVIDPILILGYSTYLGGSNSDQGNGIAVDSSGNAYVTGYTASTDFPTANPLQPNNGGGGDAFVAKLNPAGSALLYSTYLGGSGYDAASGIAVDSSGNAYITGYTASTDFPTANPLQPNNGGEYDAFVAKLNPTGSALVYSTYLGGSGGDAGYGIALDSSGNAYVTGYTESPSWCGEPPPTLCYFVSLFVAKLNPSGSALVYSYSIGLADSTVANSNSTGIAVDSSGNAYITGYTNSVYFPVVNPAPGACVGTCGTEEAYPSAFVAKLNAAGSALVYSTYLGGSGGDLGCGIAVDSAGNAYVTGLTVSYDFPVVNPASGAGGGGDAFVTKLNAAGSALVYSTRLGGSGDDIGYGIALDSSGNAYVTGATESTDFPTANALQATHGGGTCGAVPYTYACPDVFVTELNPSGSPLVYSTYLGGSGLDQGNGIAVDCFGNAYVTGYTESTDFPTANPLQATYGGGWYDAFVAKIGALTLSPKSLSFSNQMLGTTSPAQSVTLSTTDPNLTISSIAIAGSVTGDFAVAWTGTTCSTSAALAAGASCTISVTFTPTIVGSESASLSVSDNLAGSPQTVPLSGTGVLLTAPNVSPTSLSFTNQLVGTTSTPQPVTVTNTGSLALSFSSLTISSGWTQSNNCLPSIAANASCTINVSFQPTAAGSQTGALALTDNALKSPQTVSLSGTGVVPAVSLSASSLSFAGQTVSTPSAPQTVTLTNTGTGTLTPLTITATGDFTQTNNCAGSVAAGASCTISVSFQPTAGGLRTGTLTLTDNASNSPQTVTLSGTGLAPVVSLSATSLSFAEQTVSTSSPPQTLLLTNTGVGALTPLTITTTGDFAQTNSCGGSVAAGAGCEISVTFTPMASGNRTGALTLTDNASNSPQTVTLSGTGVRAAVSLSASSLTFASQLVGTTSSSQPVSLSNTGNAALTITGIATSANFGQTNNCGGSVAASGSCTINVTFSPTATGTLTGTLTITDNSNGAAGSTQTVSLTGTGVGTAVTLSPTSLSFGAQLVGSSSVKTVTLTNLGSTPLSISSLAVVSFAPLTPMGTKAGDFAIESGSCVAGGSVAGPGSCTINLAFKPTAAGVRSATLVIADSDPSSPQTVSLSGTGTALRLSATSLGFGAEPVDTASAPETLTLANLANTPLRIASLTLRGTDAGDFAIQSNSTCAVGKTVAGEGRCTINLAFKPTALGAQSATLVISNSDPGSPQTVSLSGTGVRAFGP